MDFGEVVSKWAKKAKENNEKTVKAVSLKLFSAVIKASPVGEEYGGTFKNNWFVGDRYGTDKTTTLRSSNGQSTITRAAKAVNGMEDWEEITLTNNLPYANVIEYGNYGGGKANGPNTINGYSKQAPSGVVRTNVKRFRILLEAEARKNR